MTESRSRAQIGVAVGAAALIALAALVWFLRGPGEPVYEIPRTVRYTITVRNPTNLLAEGGRFWAFAPVAQTASQRVVDIKASMPYTVEADEFGNQRMIFVADIPPYGTKNVSIDVDLEMANKANRLAAGDTALFLAAEDKIESDHESIMALATNLSRDTEASTADAIFGWVSTNITYTGYVRDDRGALYALNERRGDCTEYSYLYTALARSAGLATRPIGGFVTAENAILRARDLHNWVEIYLDNTWRVIDPQNRKNRTDEHQHIAFRILGAASADMSSTHQMVGADAGLEVRLN